MRSIFALALTWTMILGAIAANCPIPNGDDYYYSCEKLKGLNMTTYSGKTVNDENCGMHLRLRDIATEPMFQYPLADPKKFYTLLLIDGKTTFVQMAKTHIPGSALKGQNGFCLLPGRELRYYQSATKRFSLHPFDVFLYEQRNGKDFEAEMYSRVAFDLESWSSDKNLCYVAGIEYRIPRGTGTGSAATGLKYCK